VAQIGCGVAQIRVQRGLDSNVKACCMAGPSSNFGSTPQRRPSTERKAMRTTRAVLYEYYIYILYVCSINVKINRKSGSVPPNL
jgi:hypothetical protein